MATNKLTAPKSLRYLVFLSTRALNKLLLCVFKFLTSKKCDMKTIDTYRPTTISIYNYLPLDAVHRNAFSVYSSLGKVRSSQTRSGRIIICVMLYRFNCLSSNDILKVLMHELTHVHQRRMHQSALTNIKTISRDGYDNYKNSPKEKEAEDVALEFTEWCQRNHVSCNYLDIVQKLLSTFPQGRFVFKVGTEGVKLLGFVPRDLSDYKEIL